MFTSLKWPDRYTRCTKETLIKQTLCVDCAARAPTSKPANFWTSSSCLDTDSFVLSECSAQTPTVQIFVEKKTKIHNLPVKGDRNVKVSSYAVKLPTSLPSHGNLLPETEQGLG